MARCGQPGPRPWVFAPIAAHGLKTRGRTVETCFGVEAPDESTPEARRGEVHLDLLGASGVRRLVAVGVW